MYEFAFPAEPLLQQYVEYFYKFSTDDKTFDRNLVLFPNTGSAITIYKDAAFVAEGKLRFSSTETNSKINMVLHLNRSEPVTIHERGRQKRIGIVFKPLGVNQFLRTDPGELRKLYNPSLITSFFTDKSSAMFCEELDVEKPLSCNAKLIEEFLLKNYVRVSNALLERCIRQINGPGELKKIEKLADESGAATRTIARLFHKYVGLSPVEFRKISQFRLAVKTRLEDRKSGISEIALENNYYDLSYMTRIFRKYTGYHASDFFKFLCRPGEGKYLYIA